MQKQKDNSHPRRINDEEYEKALANTDNARIMWKVKTKFRKIISPDELDRCGKIALFNALKKHNPDFPTKTGKPQKFTTSLTRYITWECLRFIRDNKPKPHISVPLPEDKSEVVSFVHECLEKTKNGDLIRRFYLENECEAALADERGITIEEIKTAIQSGLIQLKLIMENNHGRDF